MEMKAVLYQDINSELLGWFLQKMVQEELETGLEEQKLKPSVVVLRSLRPAEIEDGEEYSSSEDVSEEEGKKEEKKEEEQLTEE